MKALSEPERAFVLSKKRYKFSVRRCVGNGFVTILFPCVHIGMRRTVL